MPDPRFVATGLADELRIRSASADAVVLVAPFITSRGLDAVLGAARQSTRLRVFTRWRASEIAAGVSDPKILEAIHARGGELSLVDTLHAKVFLFDAKVAFVGSANLTERGLGVAAKSNLEAMAVLEPPPNSLHLFVEKLQRYSTRATVEEMERMLRAAEEFPKPLPHVDRRVELLHPQSTLFPSLRTPERLPDLYMDLGSALTASEREQAISDLLELDLPDGLTGAELDSAIAKRLRSSDLVQGLAAFLTRAKRFGEVTEWLKTLRTYSDHKAAQRHAQTLIRWLLHYLPGEFRLAQPHYTEMLERTPPPR